MGSLLVVTGPPGAGKSTLARVMADTAERRVLVEGDAFFAFLASGRIDPWLPGSDEQNTVVTKAAASAAGRFVCGGYATVYDGVVGPWFLPTFAEGNRAGRPRLPGPAPLCRAMCAPGSSPDRPRLLRRSGHAQDARGVLEQRHRSSARSPGPT